MAHGQDQSVVFVRDHQDVHIASLSNDIQTLIIPTLSLTTRTNKPTTIQFNPCLIVFCGKTYRGVTCYRKTELGYMGPYDEETKTFYSYDDLAAYLAIYDMTVGKDPKFRYIRDVLIENSKSYLNRQGTDELSEFCIANRFVTLSVKGADWEMRYRRQVDWTATANGGLQQFQFFKVFDAFTAYQEIDMFVSGTLPQSIAMPINISDKDRIQQHGFDKFSFRKPKEK
jgi:hypothetical protein